MTKTKLTPLPKSPTHKRQVPEAQLALLQAEFATEETEVLRLIGQEQAQEDRLVQDRVDMAKSRHAD